MKVKTSRLSISKGYTQKNAGILTNCSLFGRVRSSAAYTTLCRGHNILTDFRSVLTVK